MQTDLTNEERYKTINKEMIENRFDLVWRRENSSVVWFHSTLDLPTMTLVLTLKMVMTIVSVMTVILHLAMEADEFDEGRTVMVVITGGVSSNIPLVLPDNT